VLNSLQKVISLRVLPGSGGRGLGDSEGKAKAVLGGTLHSGSGEDSVGVVNGAGEEVRALVLEVLALLSDAEAGGRGALASVCGVRDSEGESTVGSDVHLPLAKPRHR